MVYEVREAVIYVLGYIWQPLEYPCCGVYKLPSWKVEDSETTFEQQLAETTDQE